MKNTDKLEKISLEHFSNGLMDFVKRYSEFIGLTKIITGITIHNKIKDIRIDIKK